MITDTQKVFVRQAGLAGKRVSFSCKEGRSAFTLIELLVVVTIISIIATLLAPALTRSKARAQAIMCVSNYRQLGYVWSMYYMDNNDMLAQNIGPDVASLMFAPPQNPNWVNNVMDWEVNNGDTNLDFVNQSLFARYAFTPNIYHCPSDRSLSQVQRNAGWLNRVRSVSMNAMVGFPGNNNLLNGGNVANPNYQQMIRENDFRDPSSIFVFLEEHPDSIDDGYFLNTATNYEWVDLPASYHNGGGSFTFADGHTEIHRWSNPATVCPNIPGGAHLSWKVNPSDLDFNWVTRHAAMEIR